MLRNEIIPRRFRVGIFGIVDVGDVVVVNEIRAETSDQRECSGQRNGRAAQIK